MRCEYRQLGDVAIQFIDGDRGKNYPSNNEFSNVGYCLFLNAKNVTPDGFSFGEVSFITQKKDAMLRKGKLEKNDVVLTTRGTVGNVAFYGERVLYSNVRINSGMLIIRPDPSVFCPEYVYWLFRSDVIQDQIKRFRSGTAQPQLPISSIKKFEIPLVDIKTQKKIAAILSALDEKIAINRAINENLERQAQALFSSLYERSNTEVGYTDMIQILGGGTPKTGENTYWNGNIAFFTPKDVGTPYTLITEKTITEEGLSHCNSRLYPVNTVFVTARGTVGKVCMSGVPMAMNQSCYALVGKEIHQLLVYFYTLKVVDRLKHKASGAVFDAITTRDFESEQIMKLSDDDVTAFLRVVEPMFQEVLNNNIENLRLSTLRDSLLPKLMSGEIDVSAVQL